MSVDQPAEFPHRHLATAIVVALALAIAAVGAWVTRHYALVTVIALTVPYIIVAMQRDPEDERHHAHSRR